MKLEHQFMNGVSHAWAKTLQVEIRNGNDTLVLARGCEHYARKFQYAFLAAASLEPSLGDQDNIRLGSTDCFIGHLLVAAYFGNSICPSPEPDHFIDDC